MSRQPTESKAPDSSESRAPPRGNDLLFEELEEGQVDYEESVASEAHSDAASARSHASGVSFGAASARSYGSTTMSPPRRVLRTSNPFAERYNPVRALRDAPPLTSRYEEGRRDPNVITNDLDEAQSRQLSTEPSSQRSNRPVARTLTLPSRRDYGFQPLDPAETARRAAQQLLDSYGVGHRPLRLISKCDGTRSASASRLNGLQLLRSTGSACSSHSTGNRSRHADCTCGRSAWGGHHCL
ncbi:hypothetical protein Pcac1_g9035 [Phytophthora cactorum]|nr:hypothetical protein Pcac1_g9035 [Phytophthora cactorum]